MRETAREPRRAPEGGIIGGGGPARRQRRSASTVRLACASLVLLCCATTLRLHSRVTSGAGAAEPREEAAGRVLAVVGDGSGAETPAASPTTETTSTMDTEELRPHNSEGGVSHGSERARARPRVACFIYGDTDHDSAPSTRARTPAASGRATGSCGPVTVTGHVRFTPKRDKNVRTDAAKPEAGDENEYGENDACKYPEPPEQVTATSVAPSTCNDIHALGFDARIYDHRPRTAQRESVEYITSALL